MRAGWIYFITNIRTTLRQAPLVIGMYIILPLAFSLMMGFSFDSVFIPEESIEPVPLAVINDDQGNYGSLLEKALKSEGMIKYVKIVSSDEAEFTLYIDSNYSQDLGAKKLRLEGKVNASRTNGTLLQSLLATYEGTILNQLNQQASIMTIEDIASQKAFLAKLQTIDESLSKNMVEQVKYNSDGALTANQFTAISGIFFLFILGLGSSVGMKTKAELQGLRKRISILPLSPSQSIIYELLTNTIIFAGLAMIYCLLWKVIDSQVFNGNPLFYLIWLIIYSFIFQVLSQLLYYIIPDKWVSTVYSLINLVFMFLGYMPLDRLVGPSLAGFFENNTVRQFTTSTLVNYTLNRNFFGNLVVGLLVAGTGFIIIIAFCVYKERKAVSEQ